MSTVTDTKRLLVKTGTAEVVIVNTRNREWVNKLIYSLGRAGLTLAEDYHTNGGQDRILVFNEE